VAGRAFAFADPKIIDLASKFFIPVTGDDWYQRRRQDDEGEFFRNMASQGPRKGAGGSTRQGIYTLTADGDLLEFKNAGQDVDATREQLERALKKWKALPPAKTKPGAVTVPEHGKVDANYSRTPPANGLIVKVFARILDVKDGGFCRGTCESAGGMKAARDFLWLTADDVSAMIPTKNETGFQYAVPSSVARRIARFHFVDNTQGEPSFWKKADVRKLDLTFTVSAATAEAITLRLDGAILLSNGKDRGYDARLGGTLRYNLKAKVFDRFDVAAVGDHWGDDTVTSSGSRPGKTPFGVAFSLADPKRPSDRVPPQAARDWSIYMGQRGE
jgi:hypothetical protein